VTASRTSAHWDHAYTTRGADGVKAVPGVSLELVESLDVAPDAPVVDVGGGASNLAFELAGGGFTDVTVLDASAVALDAT
jgi:2-polyprenyl-3-methyl-5-hydroxy-6-metoxy-1,4-benzoquinol methylase